jgi:peptidoglycan/LPS O-acetylase OafA/YrhL
VVWISAVAQRIVAPFQRVTASGRYIPEVDGLRGIAILAVLFHHLTAVYLTTTQRLGAVTLPADWKLVVPQSFIVSLGYTAHYGVQLFFVISGFVLALPYVEHYRTGRPRPRLLPYYLRRLVRLEPVYLLNMLLAFGLIYLTNLGWREFIPHLGPSLLYMHALICGGSSWINGVAWSLEVEIQFYLVMPLLAFLLAPPSPRWRRGVLLTLVVGLALLSTGWIENAGPLWAKSLPRFLHFFLAGFLLADLYHDRNTINLRRHAGWDATALASLLVLFLLLTRWRDFRFLTALLILTFYVALYLGKCGHRLTTTPGLVAVGGISYTLYLYHMLLFNQVAPYTLPLLNADRWMAWDMVVQGLLLLGPALLLSAALYLAVEKPFMRLSRTLNRRFEKTSL